MRLRDWIHGRRIRLVKVSELVGVTPGYMSRIKEGHVLPSLPVALRIRDVTGGEVSPDDLLAAYKERQG